MTKEKLRKTLENCTISHKALLRASHSERPHVREGELPPRPCGTGPEAAAVVSEPYPKGRQGDRGPLGGLTFCLCII